MSVCAPGKGRGRRETDLTALLLSSVHPSSSETFPLLTPLLALRVLFASPSSSSLSFIAASTSSLISSQSTSSSTKLLSPPSFPALDADADADADTGAEARDSLSLSSSQSSASGSGSDEIWCGSSRLAPAAATAGGGIGSGSMRYADSSCRAQRAMESVNHASQTTCMPPWRRAASTFTVPR